MIWYFILLGLLGGMLVAIQTGVNAQLRIWLGQPSQAALISFMVGTLGLLIYNLILRVPLPSLAKMSEAPWWAWSGGFLGAFYVAISIVLAPRLGASVLLGTIITGQLIISLFLDHYGLLGFPQHSISFGRIVGSILLLSGVFLIRNF